MIFCSIYIQCILTVLTQPLPTFPLHFHCPPPDLTHFCSDFFFFQLLQTSFLFLFVKLKAACNDNDRKYGVCLLRQISPTPYWTKVVTKVNVTGNNQKWLKYRYQEMENEGNVGRQLGLLRTVPSYLGEGRLF